MGTPCMIMYGKMWKNPDFMNKGRPLDPRSGRCHHGSNTWQSCTPLGLRFCRCLGLHSTVRCDEGRGDTVPTRPCGQCGCEAGEALAPAQAAMLLPRKVTVSNMQILKKLVDRIS